jgi:hypothetical protein
MITGAQVSQQDSTIRPPGTLVLPPHEKLSARRGFLILSVALSFSYAVFNSMYLGRPEKRVTWETVCLAVALTLIFSAYEYLRHKSSVASFATQGKVVFSASRKMTILSLVSVGVILLFVTSNPAPHVYAAALDARLKSLTASPNALDPSNIGKIISAVNAASESGLKLRPKVLDAASSTVLEASLQDSSVWSSALGVMAYRSTQSRAETSDLNKRECFASPVTDEIRVFVDESHFAGCSERLDSVSWKDVVFENGTIIYSGGPTKLEDVQFKNCRFAIDYTPRGQELAKALAASDRVTVDLSNR